MVKCNLLSFNDSVKVLIEAEAEVEIKRQASLLEAWVAFKEVVVLSLACLSVHITRDAVAVSLWNGWDVGDLAADLAASLPHGSEV